MKNYNFKIFINKDQDDYFIANVPALPGCHTQAKTYEQLMTRVREAIELCLEVMEEDISYKKAASYLHQPRFFGVEDISIRA